MLIVVLKNPMVAAVANADPVTKISNSNKLGWVLYTQYSYPVELASMLLLLGLVVAVALTLRKSEKAAKYQNIAKQVATDSRSRFTMVKMDAEVESKGEQQ
jgi:NADH-quinone oxidoreductase subunit J